MLKETNSNTIRKVEYNRFFHDINTKIKKGTLRNLTIDLEVLADRYVIHGTSGAYENTIREIRVTHGVENLVFDSLSVKRIIIQIEQEATSPVCNIELINCNIGTLSLNINKFSAGQRSGFIDFSANNSYVCELSVHPSSIRNFTFTNGGVLNISSPPTAADNPFFGSVKIQNVFIPRNTRNYPIPDAQPYREMRHHLMALKNDQAAGHFHSAILAIERESDPNINKIISYLYESFSDFGNSILRPMLWIFYLTVVFMFIYYYSDDIGLARDETTYKGWELILTEHNVRLLKSWVFALQNINPLRIFSVKLLVAKNQFIFYISIFQSILSIILVTLLILAIRRRFKLNL
jgi:hypothetical protein